jgi:hypothetical protein
VLISEISRNRTLTWLACVGKYADLIGMCEEKVNRGEAKDREKALGIII